TTGPSGARATRAPSSSSSRGRLGEWRQHRQAGHRPEGVAYAGSIHRPGAAEHLPGPAPLSVVRVRHDAVDADDPARLEMPDRAPVLGRDPPEGPAALPGEERS